MEEPQNEDSTSETTRKLRTKIQLAKGQSTFIVQILILLVVIAFSLYNLSVKTSERELWISLLSSSLGYILPNPKIKK